MDRTRRAIFVRVSYGVRLRPEAYLIGPDRRLRAVRIPVDKLREVVATALPKKH